MDPRFMLPAGHIKTVWEHLHCQIDELNRSLSDHEEVEAIVYLFGGEQIRVEEFGYAGPNLLIVHGTVGEKKISAYIHQSCLQVVFSVISKVQGRARAPIGFIQPEEGKA